MGSYTAQRKLAKQNSQRSGCCDLNDSRDVEMFASREGSIQRGSLDSQKPDNFYDSPALAVTPKKSISPQPQTDFMNGINLDLPIQKSQNGSDTYNQKDYENSDYVQSSQVSHKLL